MLKGRRPQPTHLKVIRGNPGRRPLNKQEPQPVKRMPPPPPNLTPRALAKWGDIAPMLMRLGILTEADGEGLALLCEAYADYAYARAELKLAGSWYYQTVNASGGIMWRAHPAVAAVQDSDRRIRQCLVEFGMTPAARARLKVESSPEQEDPAEKYFS